MRLISAWKATVPEIGYYQAGHEYLPLTDDEMPAEIDFSKGVRGLHHIPPGAKVFMPASIERNVWEYFAGKAKQQGVGAFGFVDRSPAARHRNQRSTEIGFLFDATGLLLLRPAPANVVSLWRNQNITA